MNFTENKTRSSLTLVAVLTCLSMGTQITNAVSGSLPKTLPLLHAEQVQEVATREGAKAEEQRVKAALENAQKRLLRNKAYAAALEKRDAQTVSAMLARAADINYPGTVSFPGGESQSNPLSLSFWIKCSGYPKFKCTWGGSVL